MFSFNLEKAQYVQLFGNSLFYFIYNLAYTAIYHMECSAFVCGLEIVKKKKETVNKFKPKN